MDAPFARYSTTFFPLSVTSESSAALVAAFITTSIFLSSDHYPTTTIWLCVGVWSSAKFESTWRDTLSVLVARGRAQVGVHSAKTDWSRRILDFQYMDYDELCGGSRQQHSQTGCL